MADHATRVVDSERDAAWIDAAAVSDVATVSYERLLQILLPLDPELGCRPRVPVEIEGLGRVPAILHLHETGEVVREPVVALEEEERVGQPPEELEAPLPLLRRRVVELLDRVPYSVLTWSE